MMGLRAKDIIEYAQSLQHLDARRRNTAYEAESDTKSVKLVENPVDLFESMQQA